jgi:protocatechuate 3,4-dioxygenase beta subunit
MQWHDRTVLLFTIALAVTVAATWQGPLAAQEARGTIMGQVTDQSGAAVPGATVAITNKAMGATQNVTTNAGGFY